MSRERGEKIMHLEWTERVGRTDYCDHTEFIKKVTGLDPKSKDFNEAHQAAKKFYEWAEYDFLWGGNDGPREWKELGRTTSMGHAVYAEGGTDYNNKLSCPFTTPDDVLTFDAAEEYGIPDIKERAAFFQGIHDFNIREFPMAVFPGGYYRTIVSGLLDAFGWDMLLLGLGTDPERFGEYVVEGIFKITQANINAWAQTNIKVFLCHDDMVWTRGAIFQPEWYRKYIFPRYKKLWQPLKEKGITVLFCSDGNYTGFIDDIADAGADGFILEPLTDLDTIVQKYGTTHVIIGNADCRPLTFGKKDDIVAEVKRCMDTARKCPGFIFATGNHLPSNIPMDNMFWYFETVKKLWKR